MDTPVPTLKREQQLWREGFRFVAGIDEAGRGALAGPVTAAAVIVGADGCDAAVWSAVRDSKQLSPRQRTQLAPAVQAAALAWAVGWSEAGEIDRIGIAGATRQAMVAAIGALRLQPDYLLLDWVKLPTVAIPQWSQARADSEIVSVAAASILAKVFRDRYMTELDALHPGYGFASHKGYGAATHLAAIRRFGPCDAHRRSFAPLSTPSLFVLP